MTAIFSQHSSNPLDVGSEDAQNSAYLARVHGHGPGASSEDVVPERGVRDYHAHIAIMFPGHAALQGSPHPDALVDLDDDDDMAEPTLDTDAELGVDDADAAGSAADDADEEHTLLLRPPDEQAAVRHEISELERAVPQLDGDYRIVDRLGTGTFSSVYKAVDLGGADRWDNRPWAAHADPSPTAAHGGKAFVAVKRIYVTSNPERMRNEIAILEDVRGCRHVSQLITAFRCEDQVVVVMPYHRNVDFRDYYRVLPMDGIKAYFRCLFRALRDVHTRLLIHRDVKPANFLFDPRTGVGTLCDFGLACRVARGPLTGACLHTLPTSQHPHGRLRNFSPAEVTQIKRAQREARLKGQAPSEHVGYRREDQRPQSKANRAGTRGFRAPEVLFKCGEQSGALDVWSAGVILLFFLTGKFPLFQSNDDVEALLEITAVLGKRRIEKAAALHSRTFASNVPSLAGEGIGWAAFVERQNPALYTPRAPDPRFWPHSEKAAAAPRGGTHPPTSSSPPPPVASSSHGSSPTDTLRIPGSGGADADADAAAAAHAADVAAALDLAERLLEPESTKRLTARGALAHPFLLPPGAPPNADDRVAPRPYGAGACGALHFRDGVTDEPCVRVRAVRGGALVESVRVLVAGEGVAFGNSPCELHVDDPAFIHHDDDIDLDAEGDEDVDEDGEADEEEP